MSESSSEEHFQARKTDKKEFSNLSQPALSKPAAPTGELDDDDDGFNQDEAHELFDDKPENSEQAEPYRAIPADK